MANVIWALVIGAWVFLVAYANLNAWPGSASQQHNDYGEDHRTS